MRILIFDDHAVTRRVISKLLEDHAAWFICGEARDGIEAVEKARTLLPDVVIMDVAMPRLDGVQATKILHGFLPKPKVIMVSQNDPLIASAYAVEAGADGFIAKNDLRHDLVRMVGGLGGEAPTA